MTELDLAARVIDLVRGSAPQAEAVVSVEHAALGLTRFANSAIHQNVADDAVRVRLKLHLSGRTVSGQTTLTTVDALGGLVDRTLTAVKVCPPDPGWPGVTPPAELAGKGTVDERIVAVEPAERAARVGDFIRAAAGLTTAGYCRTSHVSVAFANSAGHSVRGAYTEAAMDGIARTASSDGVAKAAGSQLSDVDGGLLGAQATAKALAGADPKELPPGRYEVVLEPLAVSDLLGMFGPYGFNARKVAERQSFVAVGEQQFDGRISLVDDPVTPGRVGLPFDPEGTPKHSLTLVRDGVTEATVYDRRTAAAAGTVSTGHSLGDSGPWSPSPYNLELVPAAGPAGGRVPGPALDSSVLDLVRQVGRGLLVTDFWYTRVLDPRTLVITGLTRNGVWLIEDGEITQAVRNFRFTQSYPRALAPGAVLGVGTTPLTIPSSWEFESLRAPALRLASWNFTGGASG
jgi:predicted Zn-dependent protease